MSNLGKGRNSTYGRHYTVTIIDRVNLITALERTEKMLYFDIYMSSLEEKWSNLIIEKTKKIDI